MNNEEFIKSLTEEQSDAFLSIRDELLAANQVCMKEIGAELATERAAHAATRQDREAINTALTDVKAAHDALFATTKEGQLEAAKQRVADLEASVQAAKGEVVLLSK